MNEDIKSNHEEGYCQECGGHLCSNCGKCCSCGGCDCNVCHKGEVDNEPHLDKSPVNYS